MPPNFEAIALKTKLICNILTIINLNFKPALKYERKFILKILK